MRLTGRIIRKGETRELPAWMPMAATDRRGKSGFPLLERPSLDGSRDGDVAKWSKAAVCKTAIHRFESGRRLHFAGVAKLASARDLKSCVPKGA